VPEKGNKNIKFRVEIRLAFNKMGGGNPVALSL
jgi:hypothetical protein